MATKLPNVRKIDQTALVHKIYHHIPLQDPTKFTQIWIFGFKLVHLSSGNPAVWNPSQKWMLEICQIWRQLAQARIKKLKCWKTFSTTNKIENEISDKYIFVP
jgi:hypothetical protein